MKVKVTENSEIVYKDETYKGGDTLEVEGELLDVFIGSGAIEEVKPVKSKSKSKSDASTK